jgi:GTP-binding protein
MGIESTAIGATLCDSQHPETLPTIKISPPAVKISMEPNTSPFAGKEGTFVTAKQLEQRIEKEKALNIGLKITKGEGGSYDISGRGELQLSILIETMRREGYEFQVRSPEVIFQEKDGVQCEPLEKLYVDVPEMYLGVISNLLSQRGALMENMENESGQIRFTYKILTRKMFGLRNQLLTATKGTAILNSFLFDYVPFKKDDETKRNGVLISANNGTAMGYSLNSLQERGDLFIIPGTEVYEGMILGVGKYEMDLEVNPTKARHQSSVRMKHDEITQTNLKGLINLTLEYALVFLAKDEMLEVTPKSLRLRKVHLTAVQREWAKRKNLTVFAKQQMGIKE